MAFDKDRSGVIETQELRAVLECTFRLDDISMMVRRPLLKPALLSYSFLHHAQQLDRSQQVCLIRRVFAVVEHSAPICTGFAIADEELFQMLAEVESSASCGIGARLCHCCQRAASAPATCLYPRFNVYCRRSIISL